MRPQLASIAPPGPASKALRSARCRRTVQAHGATRSIGAATVASSRRSIDRLGSRWYRTGDPIASVELAPRVSSSLRGGRIDRFETHDPSVHTGFLSPQDAMARSGTASSAASDWRRSGLTPSSNCSFRRRAKRTPRSGPGWPTGDVARGATKAGLVSVGHAPPGARKTQKNRYTWARIVYRRIRAFAKGVTTYKSTLGNRRETG